MAVLVGALAAPAFAVRTEFIAQREGKRLAGSRVCFFPAAADDGFFAKFLAYGDTRCLDADQLIDVPPGAWNIYVEHPDGYTSTHPEFQIGETETTEQREAYRPLTVALVPAATLDATAALPLLGAGERLVIYLPNAHEPHSPASVRPLRPGDSTMLVPANMPIVPMIVRDARIVRIGLPLTLKPREHVPLPPFEGSSRIRMVAALVRVSPQDYDLMPASGAPTMVVQQSDGSTVMPLLPMRDGMGVDRSLVFFPRVKGDATLIVGGTTWLHQRVDLPATNAPAQVASDVIYARPAGAVSVNYVLPADLDVVSPMACKDARERPKRTAPTTITLRRCAAPDSVECAPVAEEVPPPKTTRYTFPALALGTYEVEVRHPALAPVAQRVRIAAAREQVVSFTLRAVRITGRVRRGTTPLRADIAFGTGETTTDEDGRYTAILPTAPGRELVTVIPCGEGAPYDAVPDEALVDGSTFDIDIPENELRLTVRDARTGSPVKDARAEATVLVDKGGVDRTYLDMPTTAQDGTSSRREVPLNVWLKVCAYHSDFESRCSEELRVAEAGVTNVTLALSTKASRVGHLHAPTPVLGGRLYWITPNGYVTESAAVGGDGAFTTHHEHDATEYVVAVTMNFPLAVIPLTPATAVTTELLLPIAPSRSFLVQLRGAQPNATLAIVADGYFVPSSVFGTFQSLGNDPMAVVKDMPLRVRGVVAAQSLTLLVGPPTNFASPDLPAGVDVSSLPQYRALFTTVPVDRDIVEVRR